MATRKTGIIQACYGALHTWHAHGVWQWGSKVMKTPSFTRSLRQVPAFLPSPVYILFHLMSSILFKRAGSKTYKSGVHDECTVKYGTVSLPSLSKPKWKSLSRVRLFQPRGLYSPWNFPGQNTGVGSLSLLQGIFPNQGLNPGLPHCRRILYQLSHKRSLRILEWVAHPFSSGSSQPRNPTRRILY